MRMKSRLAIGLLLAGAVSAYGQQGGSPGVGDTSGRQLFLSGKVMLADGTPPGEPVTIERVCYGQRRSETYTDSKGRFRFQLGAGNSLAVADASTSSASSAVFGGSGRSSGNSVARLGAPSEKVLGQVDLTGCELRALLPGYQSQSIELRKRSVFDSPNVGVIVLHPIAKGQGISVSGTSLAAPKQARKAYEKALKELRKKDASRKPEKAINQLEKAVAEYPEYAAAWSLLGRTRLSINDKEGAREAFDKAMKADPKYLRPYISLLRMEWEEQRWAEVNLVSERLLNLNPHMTEVQFYRAVAAFNLGKMDLAEDLALDIQSGEGGAKFPGTHRLLGMIHARQGNFPLAATAYRGFIAAQPMGPVTEDLRRQLSDWEALGVIPKTKTAALTAQGNPASLAGEK